MKLPEPLKRSLDIELIRDIGMRQRIFAVMVFLTIPNMLANFRHREFGDSSVDFQVLMKLGFWAVCIAICAYFYRLWIGKFARLDNVLLLPFFLLMIVSCFYAPSTAYSLGAAFSVISLVTIFYASSSILNEGQILKIILGVLIFILLLGFGFYFAAPNVGRTMEWVGNNLIPSNRLAGVTGANSTGFISALCILISISLRRTKNIGKNAFFFALGISILALLASNSKTATFALMAALGVMYFSKLYPERLALLFGGIALSIVMFFMVDFNALFALLSRSGNPEEITTGTGRVYIWSVVMELIHQKPFTGWGFASGAFIIPMHADEIGHTPPHAHNTFLQTTFAMGIFGLILYVAIFLIKMVYAIRFRDSFKISMGVFLLVHGLTEASIFQGVAGVTTLAFCLMMVLEYQSDKKTINPA